MELASPGQLELISFEIGGQEFCIDTQRRAGNSWLDAGHRHAADARLYPAASSTLRGAVMPVLDLTQPPRTWQHPSRPRATSSWWCSSKPGWSAFLVDAVQGDLHGRCGAAQSAAADGYDRRTLRRRHHPA
ncbi:hypothetical protein ACRAWD_22350 [Caulobacter segnis]